MNELSCFTTSSILITNLLPGANQSNLTPRRVEIDRASSQNHSHKDLYVAIHNTFAAAQRQLKRYVAVQKS